MEIANSNEKIIIKVKWSLLNWKILIMLRWRGEKSTKPS